MIFPQDVQRLAVSGSKLSKSDIIKVSLGGTVVVNIAIAMVLSPYLVPMGFPLWALLLLQVVVTLFIGVMLFRVFVMKEDEKLLEYETKGSDSFSKYFFIRNISSNEGIRVGKKVVPVYEYDNGSVMTMIRLKLGANDQVKSNINRKVLEQIYKILGSAGLEVRTIISKEDFRGSQEAREIERAMSEIKDPKFSKKMLDIMRGLLKLADEEGNVSTVTFEIRTRMNYQKYEMSDVLAKIFRILEENKTSFRKIETIQKKPLLEIFQEFYGLEAIDLSLMRIRSKLESADLENRYIEIYQIIDENGKAYVNKSAEIPTVRSARKINL